MNEGLWPMMNQVTPGAGVVPGGRIQNVGHLQADSRFDKIIGWKNEGTK